MDDKVWFGVWIAYSALAAATTLAVMVGGGDWSPWLLIAVNGIIICHLYWRIMHEFVRVFIVEPSRSEQGCHTATDDERCPDCGAKAETGWAYCPECAEWREL